MVGLSTAAAEKPKKPAPAKDAKPCVEKLHVIYGCNVCETMVDWLKKGGVELDYTEVQNGAFRLYPMVVYSDKTMDHGERMYKQEVSIPAKLCVIRCNVGTE